MRARLVVLAAVAFLSVWASAAGKVTKEQVDQAVLSVNAAKQQLTDALKTGNTDEVKKAWKNFQDVQDSIPSQGLDTEMLRRIGDLNHEVDVFRGAQYYRVQAILNGTSAAGPHPGGEPSGAKDTGSVPPDHNGKVPATLPSPTGTPQERAAVETGNTAFQSGQWQGAEKSYREAAASDPNNKAALQGLAQSLHQQGRTAEAAQVAKKLLSLDPENEAARFMIPSEGLSAGVADRFKGQAAGLMAAPSEEDGMGGPVGMGRMTGMTERRPSGQQAGGQADAQQPAYTAAALGSGQSQAVSDGWTRFRLGDFQAARDAASLALAKNPADAAALTLRAAAHNRAGQPEAALADADAALKLAPRSVVALLERGYAKYQLRRYREALDDVEAALGIDPLNAMGHLYRGMILEKLDRVKDAVAAYFKAGELDPSLKPLTDEAAARLGGKPVPAASGARRWNAKRLGLWGGGVLIALAFLALGLRRLRHPDWATPMAPTK
ncbi:MAG: tetratricopeptide repeat protein [Elusimicrobia bacterium]|nr:tetratricopeptide repeat protein [Elusimicrobiota bacterium]